MSAAAQTTRTKTALLDKVTPWNNPALWITILGVAGAGALTAINALNDIDDLQVAQAKTDSRLGEFPRVFPPVETQKRMKEIETNQKADRSRLKRIEDDVDKIDRNVEEIKNFLLRRNDARRP